MIDEEKHRKLEQRMRSESGECDIKKENISTQLVENPDISRNNGELEPLKQDREVNGEGA